ncbi:MAG: chemotaxis protein CheV [Oligoflexales bacterium]|nr:chemotaxis protein CheV [Oligoflexales bacterium]
MIRYEEKNLGFLDQFEVGRSFFELIEFTLVRHLPTGETITGIYGVNVAKVREVVHMPKINPLASRIPGIAGIFELRGVPIPAINLGHILGDSKTEITSEQQIIVTEFSQKRAGFIVTNTNRIRRIKWEKVLPPSSDSSSCLSGMILIENNEFLFILDLEKILNDLEVIANQKTGLGSPVPSNSLYFHPSKNINQISQPDSDGPTILFVDDSSLIRQNISKALEENGYRVITATNGMEGLEKLNEIASGNNYEYGSVDCIITDVEMPLMDGLSMIKKIREYPSYVHIPVLLHTSLSGEVTQTAASSVGANGYVLKSDIRTLINALQDLLKTKRRPFG